MLWPVVTKNLLTQVTYMDFQPTQHEDVWLPESKVTMQKKEAVRAKVSAQFPILFSCSSICNAILNCIGIHINWVIGQYYQLRVVPKLMPEEIYLWSCSGYKCEVPTNLSCLLTPVVETLRAIRRFAVPTSCRNLTPERSRYIFASRTSKFSWGCCSLKPKPLYFY